MNEMNKNSSQTTSKVDKPNNSQDSPAPIDSPANNATQEADERESIETLKDKLKEARKKS